MLWTIHLSVSVIFCDCRAPGEIQEILDQGETLDPLDQRWARSSTFVVVKFSKEIAAFHRVFFSPL